MGARLRPSERIDFVTRSQRGQNRYFIDEDGPMTLQDMEQWLLTKHNKRFPGKTLKQWFPI